MNASPRATLLDQAGTAAACVAATALLGIVVVEAWQVIARYVFNDSPSWTEPVALLLLSTTMMLGAAVAVRNEAHFGFFILIEASAPPVGSVLRCTARAIVAATGLVLAIYGARLMADSWWFDMAGVPLPQGVIYLPMTVGGALMTLFASERLARSRLAATTTSG